MIVAYDKNKDNIRFDIHSAITARWKEGWAIFSWSKLEALGVYCNSEEAMVWALECRIHDLRFQWEAYGKEGILIGYGKTVAIEWGLDDPTIAKWDCLSTLEKDLEFSPDFIEELIATIEKRRLEFQ